jgi:methylase of polypeptide subunit release factors
MLMLAQCGCGVQSLSVAVWRAFCGVGPASAATCVTMIDQSQRAVRFAKFNSLLNDVTSAVYCGDATDASSLLSPLPTFDAVLINPP